MDNNAAIFDKKVELERLKKEIKSLEKESCRLSKLWYGSYKEVDEDVKRLIQMRGLYERISNYPKDRKRAITKALTIVAAVTLILSMPLLLLTAVNPVIAIGGSLLLGVGLSHDKEQVKRRREFISCNPRTIFKKIEDLEKSISSKSKNVRELRKKETKCSKRVFLLNDKEKILLKEISDAIDLKKERPDLEPRVTYNNVLVYTPLVKVMKRQSM